MAPTDSAFAPPARGAEAPEVLILDDDSLVGMLIDTIARLAGLPSHLTERAEDFYAALEQLAPSHIVLDLTLDGGGGEEVLDELARRGCTARIVLTSGDASERLAAARAQAQALGLRVAGVLPKPFPPQALRALLAPALASAASLPHPPRTAMHTTDSGLQYEDNVTGSGEEAKAGQNVKVHYTGWLYNDGVKGAKFDSSKDRGDPFRFGLGGGQVIRGWDEGVQGMKVGGTRTLVIPPQLGYGARGAGGVIPPNATLMFEVELLAV